MRSLRAALLLGGVALLGLFLLAFHSDASAVDTMASTGRSLLALAPIRETQKQKKSSHRHGRVEYRYQNVDCEDGPTFPTTSTTTVATTTVATTTTTVTTVPTSTTTAGTTPTTTTEVTTSTTTEEPTTTSPCVTCPPTTDLCNPWVCINDDQEGFKCVQIPVECNDMNPCTIDSCVNGTCMYVLDPTIDGCNCATKDCMSTPCDPMLCVETPVGPECIVDGPPVCNDMNNCTDDICIIQPDDTFNCTFIYNETLPGCENIPGGGLSGGAIAGIAIAAVAAVAIAALLAFWARKKPPTGAGTTGATTTPLATTSPLYADPVNAGVMPAL